MQFRYLTHLFLLLSAASSALACPEIHGRVDFNCDQKYKIVITGDSIVRGVGDTQDEFVGYPGRLKQDLPYATVENLGIPGITSERLLKAFKKTLNQKKPGSTEKKSKHADIFIIAVGINDYWSFRPPALTVQNISRLVDFVAKNLRKKDGTSPLIAVVTLTRTNRRYQQPFVESVNRLLLKYRSSHLPTFIRFDGISTTLLRTDGLHPSAAGYDKLTSIVKKYISGVAQEQSLARRVDFDQDGVYDVFERIKFLTDSQQADTDTDGLTDGQELFTYSTNPLAIDTDGDGTDDFHQVMTPTPTPTPTEIPIP